MAEYNKKWADLFPATIGNQNRPAAGVDNTLPYETDKFPQHIANDPVRYDKMNAVVSQSMSNDERLNEKIKRTSDDLAAHNKDPKAHATGISGNAATASKLASPRTISLTGKAAGSTSFDGSANAAINVTSVNADTASKLSTARKINITGNATGAANFDGSGDISINTTVNESKHAAKATQDTNGRAFTDTNAYMHISALANGTDFNNVKTTGIYYCTEGTFANKPHNSWGILTVYSIGTVKQEYRPDNVAVYYTREYNNANWTEWSKVNAANADTATKLATPRTISLTGNATGSANFDGSGNISINTTVNNSAAVGNHAESDFLRYRGATTTNGENTLWSQIGIKEYNNVLPESLNGTYAYGAVISFPSANNRLDIWYDCYASNRGTGLYYRTGWANDKGAWARLLDSNNYTNYTPTKTGGGASGTWPISITGNAASATTATNATNADTVDGIHAASLFYNKGNWASDNWATIGTYQVNNNSPVSNAYGWGQVISSSTKNARFQLYASDQYGGNGRLHYRTGWDNSEIYPWNTILDSENYNLFAPTKTGGGASGTWPISISGNATNTDKLDGYHASDIFRHLGGNQTPVITDIFDRAGTIDMSTMSAADKATHKANINRARNATQNIWNTDTGISAYGGDYDMANGYGHGSLKLTQSYKNFDKILVVGANDRGELLIYKLWDVWALANAFAGGSRFQLFHGGDYWFLYGSTRKGTWADYALSTDTVWSCQEQNSGIVAIYGIKY